MISSLRGIVISIDENGVFLIPEGSGVEFYVQVPDSSVFCAGMQVQLHTHLHWNSEQGPTLFGFKNTVERQLFLILISCSGVGPRLALAVLSHMQPAEFAAAVQQDDVRALSGLRGIGPKKAEQLIVFCRHKMGSFLENCCTQLPGHVRHFKGVADVLYSLNYGRSEVQRALTQLHQKSYEIEPTFDQLVRDALSTLAKRV